MGNEKEEREVRHELHALLAASQFTSGSAGQVLETYAEALEPAEVRSLQAISQAPAFVAGAPEEGWKSVAQYMRKVVEILERLLEEQRSGRVEAEKARDEAEKARKTDRVWAVIGWVIAIVSILVAVIIR